MEFIADLYQKPHRIGFWGYQCGQSAALAVEFLPALEKEAKGRMAAGGGDKKSGKQIIAPPMPDQGKARDKAAELAGTNRQYVSDAKKLKEESPEAFEKVKTGELVGTNPGPLAWLAATHPDSPLPRAAPHLPRNREPSP